MIRHHYNSTTCMNQNTSLHRVPKLEFRDRHNTYYQILFKLNYSS